jgi:Ca2+-binding EF-hand superfamily protein
MKKRLLWAMAIGLCSTSAIANDVAAWDTNEDGALSPSEHAAGAKSMFATMDDNLDGVVTAAEMTQAHAAVTGEAAKPGELTAEQKIAEIDSNRDGELSSAEHEAGARTMFDAMDVDVNGALSQEELDAGHAALKSK